LRHFAQYLSADWGLGPSAALWGVRHDGVYHKNQARKQRRQSTRSLSLDAFGYGFSRSRIPAKEMGEGCGSVLTPDLHIEKLTI